MFSLPRERDIAENPQKFGIIASISPEFLRGQERSLPGYTEVFRARLEHPIDRRHELIALGGRQKSAAAGVYRFSFSRCIMAIAFRSRFAQSLSD